MAYIVQFVTTAFEITAEVPVLTIQATTGELARQPAIALLGPHAPGAANVEAVRTRNMMYLPARYASVFLNASGITPRAAWETLIPMITQDGRLGQCSELVNWLRVALTIMPAPPPDAANPNPLPV